MSKFVVNGDMFGKYAETPTGFSKEMHIYKIVSAFESNSYCDIPLGTVNTKETLHKQIETVLNVIHCGIDESEVVRVALKDCQIINNQPQVQQWIPCSERLPDEAFPCLVTVIDTEPMAMEDFNNILPYFVGYDGETWNDEDGEVIPFDVIAWQPLPEPYQESEET